MIVHRLLPLLATGGRLSSFLLGLLCCFLLQPAHDSIAQTKLYPGDLAIIATNFNGATIQNPDGSGCGGDFGTDDFIAFVTFVNIDPGTEIIVTDNAYLRTKVDTLFFRNCEGIQKFIRTGATIPAGSIFYLFMGHATNLCPLSATSCMCGWDLVLLDPVDYTTLTVGRIDIATGTGDQLFILQGQFIDGGSNEPFASCDRNSLNKVVGRLLFSATSNFDAPYTSGWIPGEAPEAPPNSVGDATNNGVSYFPPQSKCLSTNIPDKVSSIYNKPSLVTTGTISQLLDAINNAANYSNASDSPTKLSIRCDELKSGTNLCDVRVTTTGFPTSFTVTVDPLGTWTGKVSTDWFDPCNWSRFSLPDNTIDVTYSPSATNNPVINQSSANSTGPARCRNITIPAGKSLEIRTIADTLLLAGNWNNSGSLTGDGTIFFNGITEQSITKASGTELFNNVVMRNNSGVLLASPLDIRQGLKLNSGPIRATGANVLSVLNPDEGAITNAAGTPIAPNYNNSFIAGRLRRKVTRNDVFYAFPVGDIAANSSQPIYIRFDASVPRDYTDLTLQFNDGVPGGLPIVGAECGNGLYNTFPLAGHWQANAIPADPPNKGRYTAVAFPRINIIEPSHRTRDYTRLTGNASVTLVKSADSPVAWNVEGECIQNTDSSNLNTAMLPAASRAKYTTGLSLFTAILDITRPFNLARTPQLEGWLVGNGSVRILWKRPQELSWKSPVIERAYAIDGPFEPLQPLALDYVQGGINDRPRAGETAYYRLAWLNEAGTTNYSNTLSFAVAEQTTPVQATLSPNPVEDVLNVQFEQPTSGTFEVINLAGQVVFTQPMSEQTAATLQVQQLAKGLYTLRMNCRNSQPWVRRFLKL
jgi:hypothetical protein